MDFVTDGAIFLGYEKKKWESAKGVRHWLACRFANAETGEALELNGSTELESVLKELKIAQRVRVFTKIKPRQDRGFYIDLTAVAPVK